LAPVTTIRALHEHVDQIVTLQGWLYRKTGKGKLTFLQVRDGTGICQAVVFRGNVDDATFEAARGLSQESSLIVTGKVPRARRARRL
jgi:asparaginyl-tRNA synthetase